MPGASLRLWSASFVVVVLFAAAGCGQLQAPSYPGETLAILRGVVANPDNLVLSPGATARLVWSSAIDAGADDPEQVAASTTVETRLPADFTIAVYNPPPDEAVEAVDGVRRARGDIYVLDDEQQRALADGDEIAGTWGRARAISLLWLDSDDDAKREADRRGFSRPLTSGFNLLAPAVDDDEVDGDGDGEALDVVPLSSVIVLELRQTIQKRRPR